jgi:TetR/AcrR family tetracycline transcriptional repressor
MARRATPLTTQEVVRTARSMIEHGGIEACSMRALATELGVQPPAVYRRVKDKDELLRLVLADSFAEVELPTVGTWQERTAELMRRLRRLLRKHPPLLTLYLASHLRQTDAARLAEVASAPLLDAGFDAEGASFAVTVVSMYTLGMTTVAAALAIDDNEMFEYGLTKMIEGLTPGGGT